MKGQIFSGEGKASEFLQIEEYSGFIQEEAGFKPFPGTLNARADPEEVKTLKEKAEVEMMEGFEKEGREFGGLKLYLVQVEDMPCCIIEPNLTRYGKDVIEICSEYRLRSKLELEDGDKVNITPGN